MNKFKLIDTRTHCMDLTSKEKAVQTLDFSGSIIDVSPSWLKATGYEKEEVLGKHFVSFLDMESLLKVEQQFPKLKDYGFVNNIQLNIRNKDKIIIPVYLNGTSKYNSQGYFEKTFCEITFKK